MAKLQIPIDDDLMQEAKLFALKNKTTLKDLVLSAIKATISNTGITTTTNKLTVQTANEDIQVYLQLASNALNELDTNKVIIFNNPLGIEIDQAPPIPELDPKVFYRKEEKPLPSYNDELTIDDVDPLGMMSDEEAEIALEEARRQRGLI